MGCHVLPLAFGQDGRPVVFAAFERHIRDCGPRGFAPAGLARDPNIAEHGLPRQGRRASWKRRRTDCCNLRTGAPPILTSPAEG